MLLPADVDGPTPPTEIGDCSHTFKSKDYPAHGVSFDQLQVFRLTPDFATPANTTFTTIATIPITPFTYTVCGLQLQSMHTQRHRTKSRLGE